MSNINFTKTYSQQSLLRMLVFHLILWGLFSLILLTNNLKMLGSIISSYRYIVILFLFIFLIFYALLQWFVLRKLFFKLIEKNLNFKVKNKEQTSKEELIISKRNNAERDKYLFFYLLSALQNKGRFMDFLSEDLSLHEDAQIGAAARVIQEKCKKTINHYFTFKHIIRKNEGETIELPYDFDRKAINIMGNIVGEPPFNGTIRHRGWLFKEKKLPKFTTENNRPDIIYPAQIEIV